MQHDAQEAPDEARTGNQPLLNIIRINRNSRAPNKQRCADTKWEVFSLPTEFPHVIQETVLNEVLPP